MPNLLMTLLDIYLYIKTEDFILFLKTNLVRMKSAQCYAEAASNKYHLRVICEA